MARKVSAWEWSEAEEVGERRDVGDSDAEGGAGEGREQERAAGAALVEGDASCADDEDDEGLGGE